MAQVVKNLDLNPKDQAVAKDIFAKMLTQMEAIKDGDMKPALIAATPALAGGGEVIKENLDDKPIVKSKAQVATARYSQNTGAERTLSDTKVLKETVTPGETKAPVSAPVKPQSANVFESPKDLNTAPKDMVAPKVETQAPVIDPQNPVLQQTQVASPDLMATPAPMAQQGLGEGKAVKDLGKNLKESKGTLTVKGADVNRATQTAVSPNDIAVTKTDVQGGTVAGGGVAAGELKSGNNDVKQEAIRSIVNQAQMLAQKGGGEIRMTLKPDHLGEIQLKVAMEGNRVNVQMTTERGEVKKLIEQGVHELRHGLASHNLSMDKLDVSLSQKDMGGFSKGQPDFGASREFAGQFQQQNSRREMFDDLSSLRGNALKSMATMDKAGMAQKVMNARGSSGRLNVVA
jgi:flagellar hook-length control protein FliK